MVECEHLCNIVLVSECHESCSGSGHANAAGTTRPSWPPSQWQRTPAAKTPRTSPELNHPRSWARKTKDRRRIKQLLEDLEMMMDIFCGPCRPEQCPVCDWSNLTGIAGAVGRRVAPQMCSGSSQWSSTCEASVRHVNKGIKIGLSVVRDKWWCSRGSLAFASMDGDHVWCWIHVPSLWRFWLGCSD